MWSSALIGAWLCTALGLALSLLLEFSNSFVGKDESRVGILYVMGGCFGENFGCSVEKISSGYTPLCGSRSVDFREAQSAV